MPISGIDPAVSTNVFGYLIDRDSTYSYFVSIDGTTLKVFDLTTGIEQTVNFPNGKAYISQTDNPSKDFRAITIGDTTFILNRTVTVDVDNYGEVGDYDFSYTTVNTYADLPGSPTLNQYVFVTGEGIFYQYQVIPAQPEIDSWLYEGTVQQNTKPTGYTQVASLPGTVTVGAKLTTTYKNAFGLRMWRKYTGIISQAAVPAYNGWRALEGRDLPRTVTGRLNPGTMGSIYVTQSISNVNYSVYLNGALLGFYLTPKGIDAASSVPGTADIAEAIKSALTLPGGVTCTRYGSTLSFSGLAPTDELVATSSNGDKTMKAYREDVSAFEDLPPNEAEGRIVKIKGDLKNNGDDYFVIYNDGIWIETYGWVEGSKPIPNSMPHLLVRENDGTWTFKQNEWNSRVAGSLDSNPNPSFIGFQLKDIFTYANRLGFVADANVILSEADTYENFYRTTLATLVDSDRIDVAVGNGGVDTLYHANPYDNILLLQSDRNQYRLSYQNYLGPKNFQIQFSTSFTMSKDIHPANLGSSVYFVDDKPEYNFAKLFEYFPKGNFQGDDADEATGPVPEYIIAGVISMAGSTRLKTVAVVSDNSPNSIYMYKYFWNRTNQNSECMEQMGIAGCR